MPVWHLRGVVLPEEEQRDVYADGGQISFSPVDGAETLVDGGFLVPGLVDVHCHPDTSAVGGPLDEELLRVHGQQCRDSGVSALRVPGAAGRLPVWFGRDADLPRVWSAGLAVAADGCFFEGWGRQLAPAQIPTAAVEEAASADGWCKLIVDWMTDDGGYEPTMSVQTVAEATRRVHEAGVTVLAGTDLPPGHLTEEIRWLAQAGLPAEAALGAGSWTARRYLDLPNITEGAPADLMAFDTDPRQDLNVPDHPARVLARGHLVR